MLPEFVKLRMDFDELRPRFQEGVELILEATHSWLNASAASSSAGQRSPKTNDVSRMRRNGSVP